MTHPLGFGPPMRCALCERCYRQLDKKTGLPTDKCIYGGPFLAYVDSETLEVLP